MAISKIKIFNILISDVKVDIKNSAQEKINSFLDNPHFEYKHHTSEIIFKNMVANTQGNSQNLSILELNESQKSMSYIKGFIQVPKTLVLTLFYTDYSNSLDLSETDAETSDLAKETIRNQRGLIKPVFSKRSDKLEEE